MIYDEIDDDLVSAEAELSRRLLHATLLDYARCVPVGMLADVSLDLRMSLDQLDERAAALECIGSLACAEAVKFYGFCIDACRRAGVGGIAGACAL